MNEKLCRLKPTNECKYRNDYTHFCCIILESSYPVFTCQYAVDLIEPQLNNDTIKPNTEKSNGPEYF